MLKLKCAFAAAAVLVSAVGLSRAADDDDTFDLRGPAPKEGQVFVSKSKLTIKDADTTMKVGGMEVTLKITLVATSEEEAKVLAVKGRDVTKCQTKIVKERADVSANFGGMDVNQTETAALEGEIVISKRDGKGWTHTLVDNKPSEKQKKELDARNGLENDDDLYPAEKVKVGHAWEAD
ncbi:MAG: hypothetical protein K2V38_29220, partial [Gemmataceae bacterium]|nr:hypothetical protein [Gemmataceae bacterium]